MEHNAELGEFLRSRRARLSPTELGVPTTGRTRRVPGLRRVELARLAGVSVDYYTRLEQGRPVNVSDSVLDAVATALQLDPVERTHLFDLARPRQKTPAQRRARRRPQRVRPGVYRLLETLDEHVPALVLGRGMAVLAANRLARALITDFDALPARERNMARSIFLDESARELYPDWPAVAVDTVGMLRLNAGRYPDDPGLTELIGELAVKSPEFRRWWADHQVRNKTHGAKRYHHPVVGELTVTYENVSFPDDPDQSVCIYTVDPGSPAETALRLLANWTATAEP